MPERRSNKQRPRTLPTAQLDTFFSGGDVNVRDQSHAPKVTATSDALRTVKEGMKHIQGEHDAHYRAKCFREKTEAHRCSSALVTARREDGPARRGAVAQHSTLGPIGFSMPSSTTSMKFGGSSRINWSGQKSS